MAESLHRAVVPSVAWLSQEREARAPPVLRARKTPAARRRSAAACDIMVTPSNSARVMVRLCRAAQTLSSDESLRRVYAHMGWRTLEDGVSPTCTAGGAIGAPRVSSPASKCSSRNELAK